MQTHHFRTVQRLGTFLADENHAVLSPTLSLGINKRKKSLDCEALHTHTINDDVAEVTFWVNWLESRGYNKITLLGHSYGSLQLLAYTVSGNLNKKVASIITSSLVKVENSFDCYAKAKASKMDDGLVIYKHCYCNKYTSTKEGFLSYTYDKFIGDTIMIFFGAPSTKGVQEDARACLHMSPCNAK